MAVLDSQLALYVTANRITEAAWHIVTAPLHKNRETEYSLGGIILWA